MACIDGSAHRTPGIFHKKEFAMNRMLAVLPASILLLSGCLLAESDGALSSDTELTAAEALPVESLAATRDNNSALGNPSNATATTSNANNFLMTKTQYTLSYNNSRGSANWVSWHLSTAWKGSAPRSTSFTSDATLPAGFVKVATSWYTNTGFDRGHLCPSEDRDGSVADNQATFLMTNIVPQAPVNNQQTWKGLEDYSRTLINTGNELYIVAGPAGIGGTGSVGSASTIHSGQVTVPDSVWKVIVVLPVGSNDVSTSTRVIAVNIPNEQTVNAHSWDFYRVSVDEVEALTGYNFLSNVSASVQSVIEASVDDGPVN
jgi:endonuclease G